VPLLLLGSACDDDTDAETNHEAVMPAAPRNAARAAGVGSFGLLAFRRAPKALDLEDVDCDTADEQRLGATVQQPSAPRACAAGSVRHSLVDAPHFLKKPPALHLTTDITTMAMPASPRHLPPPSSSGRFASPRTRQVGSGTSTSKLPLPPSVVAAVGGSVKTVAPGVAPSSPSASLNSAPVVSAMSLDLAPSSSAADESMRNNSVQAVPELSADAKVSFLTATPVAGWSGAFDSGGRVPFSAAADVSRLLPPISVTKRSLTPTVTPRTAVVASARPVAEWQVM